MSSTEPTGGDAVPEGDLPEVTPLGKGMFGTYGPPRPARRALAKAAGATDEDVEQMELDRRTAELLRAEQRRQHEGGER